MYTILVVELCFVFTIVLYRFIGLITTVRLITGTPGVWYSHTHLPTLSPPPSKHYANVMNTFHVPVICVQYETNIASKIDL